MSNKKKNTNMKADIVSRVSYIYFGMLFFAFLIVVRLLYLQIGEKEQWTSKAKAYSKKQRKIESKRGDIFSDDGRILAVSVPFYRLAMDLKSPALKESVFNQGVDSLAYCLAELFNDKTKEEYLQELLEARKNRDAYHVIQPRINYLELQKVKTFPIFREGRYKGGLAVDDIKDRELPNGKLAARTIGYNTGKVAVGIEQKFDYYLRGKPGFSLMQKLSGKDVWMPLNKGITIEPKHGYDIVTTIDIDLQDAAEKALEKQLIKLQAKHGTAVVMEVETGEIKAIANLAKTGKNEYNETYNFAIGEAAEPGSTFKLVSMIVALEDGVITPNTLVNTGNGIIKYNGFPIRDSHRGGYGTITAQRAFELSSNVGISKIIYQNYARKPKKFIDRIYSMNLNEKTGIKISGEPKPQIKYAQGDEGWSKISLPQMSIGYEVKIAPIQTLTFYNAVANKGKMVRPRIVKEIREFSHTVKKFDPEVINSTICSQKTIDQVTKMLIGVVKRGTAKNIYTSRYKIAGKTGTAQIAYNDKGYKKHGKRYQASFVGFFPAEKPKYSCIVVVNSPTKYSYSGAWAAAPVFREIADQAFATCIDMHEPVNTEENTKFVDIPYSKSGYEKDLDYVFKSLGIPIKKENNEKTDWILTRTHDKYVLYQPRKVEKGIVPRVKGMGARDAVYILENIGLQVVLHGRGVVKEQSLPANTKFKNGQKIVLKLG